MTACALQTLLGRTRSKTVDVGTVVAAVVVRLRVEVVVGLRVEVVVDLTVEVVAGVVVTIVLVRDTVCRIARYTTRWLPCACGLSQNLL